MRATALIRSWRQEVIPARSLGPHLRGNGCKRNRQEEATRNHDPALLGTAAVEILNADGSRPLLADFTHS
jgi:hypothetical protein